MSRWTKKDEPRPSAIHIHGADPLVVGALIFDARNRVQSKNLPDFHEIAFFRAAETLCRTIMDRKLNGTQCKVKPSIVSAVIRVTYLENRNDCWFGPHTRSGIHTPNFIVTDWTSWSRRYGQFWIVHGEYYPLVTLKVPQCVNGSRRL